MWPKSFELFKIDILIANLFLQTFIRLQFHLPLVVPVSVVIYHFITMNVQSSEFTLFAKLISLVNTVKEWMYIVHCYHRWNETICFVCDRDEIFWINRRIYVYTCIELIYIYRSLYLHSKKNRKTFKFRLSNDWRLFHMQNQIEHTE